MRVNNEKIQLAWSAPKHKGLLDLVKHASRGVIRRAADAIQARDPKDAAKFRAWLDSHGVLLHGRPGAPPPRAGDVKSYKNQILKGHGHIHLPTGLMSKGKGEEVWVEFESEDRFIVHSEKPAGDTAG